MGAEKACKLANALASIGVKRQGEQTLLFKNG